jgi:hypothetical protein
MEFHMQNNEPLIYDGSPRNPVSLTPFGFFDAESAFQIEAPKVADYISHRLGYPVVDVELTDQNIYTCFEEAIVEYGAQVNQFNARENMLSLQGISTGSIITQRNIVGSSLPQIIKLSANYGTEAGSGGNVQMKKGYVTATASKQEYDLQELWANVSESGQQIEIRKVYHELQPAIARYYDPFATTGLGLTNLMSEFGFDGYSPPVTFVMMPAYEDLLRIQAIEINDMVRKSQYSFQIFGNKIRFTPIFTKDRWEGRQIWFDYMVVNEKSNTQVSTQSGSVSDISNVPYQNITYSTINSIGRNWIYKYTLATAKELLGIIRSKYERIPIPDREIKLDGDILRREGAEEKAALIKELRETLEQTGLQKQMEKQAQNAEYMSKVLQYVPSYIYIG